MQVVMPPWSYTALETFESCPRKYYHRYILKEKEPETAAIIHGNVVHKLLEDRLTDKITDMGQPYSRWESLVQSVKRIADGSKLLVEAPLAVRKDMSPCGFFDKDVWGRGKADVLVIRDDKAWVGDWKTGKVKEKETQVKIFAGFIFKMFPQVNDVFACNLWLVDNKPGCVYNFNRAKHEAHIWADIAFRVSQVETCIKNNAWPEKSSLLCNWCSIKPCRYYTGRNV